jgi:DNA-binding PadR family transcriptional regulator
MGKELLKKLKKKFGKRSLQIRLQESDLYEYNPAANMLLMVICLGQRRVKENYDDTFVQEDCPKTAEELVGWCDQAQWRLALRSKMSESQVLRYLKRFEDDGVIEIDGWTSPSTGREHRMYRIIEEVVDEHQRPEQSATVERPSRYKTKSPNRGRFTSKNQPEKKKKSKAVAAGVDENFA